MPRNGIATTPPRPYAPQEATHPSSAHRQQKSRRPVRLRGDDRLRRHQLIAVKSDAKRLHQSGEHKRRLRHRELRAYADARTRAKRQVRKARRGRSGGEKARRVEGVRIAPEAAVTVQNPRRDHHQGAARDFEIASAVGPDRNPDQSEGRRVKPQRFADDGSGLISEGSASGPPSGPRSRPLVSAAISSCHSGAWARR